MECVNPPIDAPVDTHRPAEVDEVGFKVNTLIETDVRNFCVVGVQVGGKWYFGLTGQYGKAASVKLATKDGLVGEHHTFGCAMCFDCDGKVYWRMDFRDEKLSGSVSVFPSFVDITGKGDWALSFSGGVGKKEEVYLKSIDGKLIWRVGIPGEKPWMNGSLVAGDFDNDGRCEIVYGACSCVFCVDGGSGDLRWVYDKDVSICHGRLSAGDVNGDGKVEIVFGTEYSDDADKCLSSMVILDGFGNEVCRKRNILGDLGSTKVHLVDVNNDGILEIVATSQNLCWSEPRHPCWIMVFDDRLNEIYPPIATGSPRLAIGDFDKDGHIEAIGITDYRDGGPLKEFAIVCADLTEGRVRWKIPVSRCWLAGDPIVADFDGDGVDEVLITTGYASGYAYQEGTETWSDVYIVKYDGKIIFTKTFPDMIYQPFATKMEGVSAILPCYDGEVYVLSR